MMSKIFTMMLSSLLVNLLAQLSLSSRSYYTLLLIGVLGGNKELRRNAWAVGF